MYVHTKKIKKNRHRTHDHHAYHQTLLHCATITYIKNKTFEAERTKNLHSASISKLHLHLTGEFITAVYFLIFF